LLDLFGTGTVDGIRDDRAGVENNAFHNLGHIMVWSDSQFSLAAALLE
jgi:hypothetical protein